MPVLYLDIVTVTPCLQRDEQAFHRGAGEEDLWQSCQTGAGVHRVLHRLVPSTQTQAATQLRHATEHVIVL